MEHAHVGFDSLSEKQPIEHPRDGVGIFIYNVTVKNLYKIFAMYPPASEPASNICI